MSHFFSLQTYLLWTHSKDCIHTNKIITRCIAQLTSPLVKLMFIHLLHHDDFLID